MSWQGVALVCGVCWCVAAVLFAVLLGALCPRDDDEAPPPA